jgi:hypothetical protein
MAEHHIIIILHVPIQLQKLYTKSQNFLNIPRICLQMYLRAIADSEGIDNAAWYTYMFRPSNVDTV